MESLSLKNPDDILESDSTSKNSVSFSDEPITPPGLPPMIKSESSGPMTPPGLPPIVTSEPFEQNLPSSENVDADSPKYIPRTNTGAESPPYNPYGNVGAESPPYNPYGIGEESPKYIPRVNAPNSPAYAPNSPAYAPNSPAYAPNSPAYASKSPVDDIYTKYSPANSPQPYIPSPKLNDSLPKTPLATPPILREKVGIRNEKKNQSKKIMDIYTRTLVSKKISVEMKYVGINIKENLEKRLKETHEGKCIAEGYVRKNTIKIITYSAGKICTTGILYEVAFECYVCFPVEGQLLNCIATNITKAGIRATSLENPSPFVVFISRDHQLTNKKFNTISEKDHFVARIIGQRFELNDPYISIIAEIDEKKRYIKNI